jgi:hypothetical protein
MKKKKDFLRLANFKLLSQIEGKSVNNFYFLKFVIYVRGGHCDYSPRAQKKRNATPLSGTASEVVHHPGYLSLLSFLVKFYITMIYRLCSECGEYQQEYQSKKIIYTKWTSVPAPRLRHWIINFAEVIELPLHSMTYLFTRWRTCRKIYCRQFFCSHVQ